jgi:RimJ/RimL family protein N-acetyltransferase
MTETASDIIARGSKVLLRRKRLADAPADYEWRCDPELASFDAAPPLRISYQDFLASYLRDLKYESRYRCTYSIEDENGRHIGNVMYYNADIDRGETELGISIGDKSYWSHGYGSDAVSSFAAYLFRERGFRRIYLHTLEWNERAQRSFAKSGFVSSGTVWRSGHKFVMMELLRDWLPPEASSVNDTAAHPSD